MLLSDHILVPLTLRAKVSRGGLIHHEEQFNWVSVMEKQAARHANLQWAMEAVQFETSLKQ